MTAFRDPAILFYDSTFYLYFTLVEIEPDGLIFSYTAQSRSKDLLNWTTPEKITPRDQFLNYSSPGNIIHYKDNWILCLQTYPRKNYTVEQMPGYGDQSSRIFTMKSTDLVDWDTPEILMVKGEDTPIEDMGRMIDPYIIEDKDARGKYWCFYKQNGVSLSYSYDFENWTFFGSTSSGENVCVIIEGNEYVLFHAPRNGIGIKRSNYLINWKDDEQLLTLGQHKWPWAKGRITAGAVIKVENSAYPFIMFFHGSGPLTEEEGDFDKNSSIGIAWSKDLKHWNWPGKTK
ncbi:MAG: hypothetical protein MI975_09570 [Cytophagales bacterium]|nr:hypothetical protein [Cytophagales bacterium]